MSKHAYVPTSFMTRHHAYRRAFILCVASILILFVAHYLEVMFATMNLLHFLEMDDVMARYGL